MSGDMVQSPAAKLKLPVPAQTSTPKVVKGSTSEADSPSAVQDGLHGLNIRFAEIINRNNQFSIENQQLRDDVASIEDSKKGAIEKIKELYETELAEARRLLDKEADKTVRSQLDMDNLRESNKAFEEKAKTLDFSEREARDLAEKLQAQVDGLLGETATMRRKTQDIENQKAELLMQLTSAKSDADKFKTKNDKHSMEISKLNTKLQSMREEHEMSIRILKQQLESAKTDQAELVQRSFNDQSTFNSNLTVAIEDIKAEHDDTLQQRTKDIKAQYAKQMKALEDKVDRGKELLSEKRDEASKNKALYDQARNNAERLDRELSRAKGRCMDLDANIASQKQMADDRINELEGIALDFKNKGKTLEDKIVHGTEKYLSLEKEVQTYRSLLEMEETRLNITPSPIRNRKRARKGTEGDASGVSPPKKSKSGNTSRTGSDIEVAEVGSSENGGNADSSCMIM